MECVLADQRVSQAKISKFPSEQGKEGEEKAPQCAEDTMGFIKEHWAWVSALPLSSWGAWGMPCPLSEPWFPVSSDSNNSHPLEWSEIPWALIKC